MENFAFLHVSDGFKASVRVVGEAAGELDVKVIKHKEGVQTGEVSCANDSSDFGPDAFGDNNWSEDFFDGFKGFFGVVH